MKEGFIEKSFIYLGQQRRLKSATPLIWSSAIYRALYFECFIAHIFKQFILLQ